MSEARFTKGPWNWSSEFTNDAHEPTYSLLGDGSYGILSCDEPNAPQSCNRHDANLIVTAPELYATVEDLLDVISWLGGDGYEVDANRPNVRKAEAILAKARGENKEVAT